MKMNVKVKFDGTVKMEVPNDFVPIFALRKAVEDVAIAQALATIENTDNGEIINNICEDFVEQGGDEELFDQIKALEISGVWSPTSSRETDIIKLALTYLLANLDDVNVSCCTSTEDDDAIVINDNEQDPIREDEVEKLLMEYTRY